MGGYRWDDAITDRLTELWKEGFSCSQIAAKLYAEFKFEISRSAVIGKLNRMGMKSNAEVTQFKNRQAQRRTRARAGKPDEHAPVAPKRAMSGLFLGGGGKLAPEEPLPKEDAPPANLKSFAEIGPGDCRFIYGDTREPSHGFCPNPAVPGQSWCAHHIRRVFRTPEPVHRAPKPERIPTIMDLEKA